MTECLFCKIVEGSLPSHKIYEDDLFIVILDKFPVAPGHCLIIPKFHVEDVFGLCEKEGPAIMPLVQKIAVRMKDVLAPDGFNILQNNGKAAGQVVFHYHMHIIPRMVGDGIKIAPMSHIYVDEADIDKMRERLAL